ncbi:MAG: DUF2179 domain-containing protein [Candidatus Delongbacteria bacterium]|jgi:uncharacterized protein YebE (UPF0316 family)|nr:DUF2179 domain-containing protein [Candidatus Delongbacteria bacterium]
MGITESELFPLIVVPVLICLARVVDVSIGTVKIIFIAKGYRFIAPILAFFEIIIWLAAISQVMKNLDNTANVIAYAVGFALGNYVGMVIEGKIALGMVVVRIITRTVGKDLMDNMVKENYGVTVMNAEGSTGPVHVIFTVIKRLDISKVVSIIKEHNPNAFYSIEDIRYVSEGVFPQSRSRFGSFTRLKKGK